MNVNDNYKLLDHAGKTIAMGTRDQMFSYVKYHVPDGRYRIVGSDIKLHCLRKDGIVEPDPDGVQLEAKTKVISIADLLDMAASDPPYPDEEGDDDDE
jgi:hypothetical protein